MTTRFSTSKRLPSMMIDHFAMTIIAMVFSMPGTFISMSSAFDMRQGDPAPDLFGGLLPLSLLGFAVFFCKDSINGRSIGKRQMGLQVVKNSSGKPASALQCLVRNLFIVIWPIEVIVTLTNPSRRIGDFVAGTRIVNFDPEAETAKPNIPLIVISLGIAYGIMLLSIQPLQSLSARTNPETEEIPEWIWEDENSSGDDDVWE